jgi:hypothetical protein
MLLNSAHEADLILRSNHESSRFLGFSPGVVINSRKGFTHEIGLMYYEIDANSEEHSASQQFYQISYEFGAYMRQKLFKKLPIRLGSGIRPFYGKGRRDNVVESTVLPQETEHYGITFSVYPHIEFPLSDHLFLDLSVSILNISMSYNVSYTDSPDPEKQFTFRTTDLDAFSHRILRIGLGWKL